MLLQFYQLQKGWDNMARFESNKNQQKRGRILGITLEDWDKSFDGIVYFQDLTDERLGEFFGKEVCRLTG